MVWDQKTPQIVTIARLLNLPASAVFEELKDYAAFQSESRFGGDDKLEQALLLRADPLINLGLARYGASHKVATVLYEQSKATGGDPGYNQALRLSIFSNQLLPDRLFAKHTFGIVPDEEVLHYINQEEPSSELEAIIRNPSAKKLLDKLYNAAKPFDRIPEEQYIRAIYWSCMNSGLNNDDSSEHGPDLDAFGIQEGIRRLMLTLPVTDAGVRTAYWLLKSAEHVGHFDEDPTPLFRRWQAFVPSDEFKKYHEGDCPDLDLKEEFLCMLAARYGSYSVRSAENTLKFISLGSPDSPDRLMRCAYYARESKLTPAQMKSGYDRDSDAFSLAAMCNSTLFWKPECRAVLERCMRGRLIHRYRRRCEQIKRQQPEFDARPVTEDGEQLLVDEIEPRSEEHRRLERLEALVVANAKQLQSVYRVLTWVLVLAIAAVVLIWKPRF